MHTHFSIHRTWLAGLLLGLVLVFTPTLSASPAVTPPDVACAQNGSTCPFVGQFSAFTFVGFGAKSHYSIYLPLLQK